MQILDSLSKQASIFGNNLRRFWHQHQTELIRKWNRRDKQEKEQVQEKCVDAVFQSLFAEVMQVLAAKSALGELSNQEIFELFSFHVPEAVEPIDILGLLKHWGGGEER
jgi:predicted DNA-binding WGR domain protein